MPAPDIAGFQDAQRRLVEALGQDISFRVPEAPVYADGVELGEDGRPYDPTVDPVSGGGHTEIVRKATVVFSPISTGDDVIEGPSGVRRDERVALIIVPETYAAVLEATEFELNGIVYSIQEMLPDGLVGIDRYIVYGEAQ